MILICVPLAHFATVCKKFRMFTSSFVLAKGIVAWQMMCNAMWHPDKNTHTVQKEMIRLTFFSDCWKMLKVVLWRPSTGKIANWCHQIFQWVVPLISAFGDVGSYNWRHLIRGSSILRCNVQKRKILTRHLPYHVVERLPIDRRLGTYRARKSAMSFPLSWPSTRRVTDQQIPTVSQNGRLCKLIYAFSSCIFG